MLVLFFSLSCALCFGQALTGEQSVQSSPASSPSSYQSLAAEIRAALAKHPELKPLFAKIDRAWMIDAQTYETQLSKARQDSQDLLKKAEVAEKKAETAQIQAEKAQAQAEKSDKLLNDWMPTFSLIPQRMTALDQSALRFEGSLNQMIQENKADREAANIRTVIFSVLSFFLGFAADEGFRAITFRP